MSTKDTAKTAPRYSIRVLGRKWDYERRYGVVDKTTGQRVDGVRGGLGKVEAQDTRDEMNGLPMEEWETLKIDDAYECPECGEGHDGMTTGTEYCPGCSE